MPVVSSRAWSNPEGFVADPDLVVSILRDPAFTVSEIGPYLEQLEERYGLAFPHLRKMARHSFAFQSGEEHLNARRAIASFFSAQAIAGWSEVAERAIATAIKRLERANEPDLMRDFAGAIFLDFVRPFIGLRGGEDARILELIRIANNTTQPMLSIGALTRIDEAMRELHDLLLDAYTGKEVAGNSLLAFLESQRYRFGAEWASDYVALAALIGSHTIAQTLAFALYGLLQREPQDWIEAAEDGWVERSLDRIISLYPSTLTLVRMAKDDVHVGGCPFHKGDAVILDVVKANAALRARFHEEAEQGPFPFLSFGSGAHKCPGTALSHLLLSRAIPALSAAFPRLALHRDRVAFHVNPLVQYPVTLPCELHGRNERSNTRLVEIKEIDTAREIVNDDELWSPPLMAPHLKALQEKSGKDLSQAIRIADNAMFFMSGKRHAEARKVVAECLGGNRLARWQPLIDASVQSALDMLATSAQPDLISDFADPLFRRITHPILGIEARDPERFDVLAPILQDVLEPWLPVREILRLQEIFGELLDGMCAPETTSGDLGTPLLTHLLQADLPDFDEADRKSLVLVLYGASFNLTHTLGNILHHLLTLPAEDRARAGDPDWIAAELEGFISLCASPKYIYRMARKDCVVGDLEIRQNETVRMQLLSINRGTATGNLAFGHGLHRCVGAALSKRMLKSALPALFQRFPSIDLIPQKHKYFQMSQTVALANLPCRLGGQQ